MSRRPSPLTLAAGVVAVAVAALAALAVGEEETTAAAERTVTVKRGVVQTTVSGSGNLAPLREAGVSFATAGEITSIAVKPGDVVSKGEELARIDASSARVALAQAEAELQSARDTLAEVQDGGETSDASTASAGDVRIVPIATSAQAPATTTTTPAAPPTSTTPAPTSTTPRATTTTPAPTSTTPRETTTTQTQTQAQGGAANQASGSSSGGGQSGGGSSTMSEEAAAAAVESAELAVKQAQEDLESTVLRAPFGGTVAAVDGDVGDTTGGGSSSGGSASSGSGSGSGGGSAAGGAASGAATTSSSSSGLITLARLSRYTMQVALTESDIASVKVGQAATVTVNAASGAQFAAKVTEVGILSSASSSGTSSAVSYPVTLTLTQSGSKLKAGMSASAEIVTAEASGLVVPTQAVQGSSVTVERDGARSTARVQTGVADDTSTIVTSGLEAGDTVVVTSRAAAAGAAAGAGGANGAAGAGAGASGTRGGFGTGRGTGAGAAGGFGGAGAGGAGGGFPGGGAPPGGGAGFRPGG